MQLFYQELEKKLDALLNQKSPADTAVLPLKSLPDKPAELHKAATAQHLRDLE